MQLTAFHSSLHRQAYVVARIWCVTAMHGAPGCLASPLMRCGADITLIVKTFDYLRNTSVMRWMEQRGDAVYFLLPSDY